MIDCKVLFVEDDELIRGVTKRGLEKSVSQITCVSSPEEALKEMSQTPYDIMVTDLGLSGDTPESDNAGLRLIKCVRETYPNTEVILQTGYGSLECAEKALRMGAADYIEKPYRIERLLLLIERALENRSLRQELSMLRQQVAFDYGYDGFIGDSATALRLKERIRQLSEHERHVLIYGETGSGKDLAGKIIHHHSKRRRSSLYILDCRVTPERLIDSELFGQSDTRLKYRFSASSGMMERAAGGALMIKHIDCMPRETQGKLLSVLQTGALADEPSGMPVDVRVIATTTVNLNEYATQGKFLETLLGKIGATTLTVPTLSDRRDDIHILAEHFLRTNTNTNEAAAAVSGMTDTPDMPHMAFAAAALEKMLDYGWPGNVRELMNVVRRASALSRGSEIMADDIFFTSDPGGRRGAAEKAPMVVGSGSSMEMTYRSRILKSLEDNNWNYSQTAIELGIGRTTLWRKVKKYNLSKDMISDTIS